MTGWSHRGSSWECASKDEQAGTSSPSLVAQTVKIKNPSALWETWVRSLVRDDPLEEGMATHSSILAWRIPMDRGA